ncbi:MAG: HEPN domain-containing protein [Bacteroidales bacterium]|nr:HEPN domain-containing protein [Bacteroidales bacterium]
MKEITISWIAFAEKDLQAAKQLLDGNEIENIVLFHCQQAIEKLLKAILVEHNIRFPKIHSTRTLYELVISNIIIDLKINEDIFIEIDSIYIDSRYPTSLGVLPSGFPTHEEAKKMFDETEILFEEIKSIIM